LSDVVAVVEATATGGARITAGYAADYGRQVFAMPGSRRNPAAVGCNELLRDGATPLLQPDDVAVGLELAHGGQAQWRPPPPAGASPSARAVLRALAGEPATLDDVIVRSALTPAEAAHAVRELEQCGHLQRRRGLLWPA
jgi:DNA processing protein